MKDGDTQVMTFSVNHKPQDSQYHVMTEQLVQNVLPPIINKKTQRKRHAKFLNMCINTSKANYMGNILCIVQLGLVVHL